MKVGTESRGRVAAMVVLMVAAGFLFVRMVRGPEPAASASATGVQTSAARRAPAKRSSGRDVPAAPQLALDPTLRLDRLQASESTEYKGSGRNIFRASAEPVAIPQPVAPALTGGAGVAGPPVPAGPPPIPLRFFGFASKAGEPKKVFLSQGEDIFIGGEGDIVNRRYKIVRIGVNSVEVEDLQFNHRQLLPLTQS